MKKENLKTHVIERKWKHSISKPLWHKKESLEERPASAYIKTQKRSQINNNFFGILTKQTKKGNIDFNAVNGNMYVYYMYICYWFLYVYNTSYYFWYIISITNILRQNPENNSIHNCPWMLYKKTYLNIKKTFIVRNFKQCRKKFMDWKNKYCENSYCIKSNWEPMTLQ